MIKATRTTVKTAEKYGLDTMQFASDIQDYAIRLRVWKPADRYIMATVYQNDDLTVYAGETAFWPATMKCEKCGEKFGFIAGAEMEFSQTCPNCGKHYNYEEIDVF